MGKRGHHQERGDINHPDQVDEMFAERFAKSVVEATDHETKVVQSFILHIAIAGREITLEVKADLQKTKVGVILTIVIFILLMMLYVLIPALQPLLKQVLEMLASSL